jgi:hypothetical protein
MAGHPPGGCPKKQIVSLIIFQESGSFLTNPGLSCHPKARKSPAIKKTGVRNDVVLSVSCMKGCK